MDYEHYYSLTNWHLFILGYCNMHMPGDRHSPEECIEYGRELVYNEIETYYQSVETIDMSKMSGDTHLMLMMDAQKYGDHTDVFKKILQDPVAEGKKDAYQIFILNENFSALSGLCPADAVLESLGFSQEQFITGINYYNLYYKRWHDDNPKYEKPWNVAVTQKITADFDYEINWFYTIIMTIFFLLVFTGMAFQLPVMGNTGGVLLLLIPTIRAYIMMTVNTTWEHFADEDSYDWKDYRQIGYKFDCTALAIKFGGNLQNPENYTEERPYALFSGGKKAAFFAFAKELAVIAMASYALTYVIKMFF